jgi:hypothetical protein
MEPVGRMAPTANFFSKGAYYRNTIVREKTAAELLSAIDDRMNGNMVRPGSVEFAAVFDELTPRGRAFAQDERRQLLPPASLQAVSSATSRVAPPAMPAPARAPTDQPHHPVPPLPVRADVSQPTPVPPSPVRAVRPSPIEAEPRPRMEWAPRDLGASNRLPLGFQD